MTIQQLKISIELIAQKLGYINEVFLFGSQRDKKRISSDKDIDLLIVWSMPIPLSMTRKLKDMLIKDYPEYMFDIASITLEQFNKKSIIYFGKVETVFYKEVQKYISIYKNINKS